jgi:hypothetical protein
VGAELSKLTVCILTDPVPVSGGDRYYRRKDDAGARCGDTGPTWQSELNAKT